VDRVRGAGRTDWPGHCDGGAGDGARAGAAGAEFLAFRPWELAHVGGVPLAARGDVALVYDLPGPAGVPKAPVGDCSEMGENMIDLDPLRTQSRLPPATEHRLASWVAELRS